MNAAEAKTKDEKRKEKERSGTRAATAGAAKSFLADTPKARPRPRYSRDLHSNGKRAVHMALGGGTHRKTRANSRYPYANLLHLLFSIPIRFLLFMRGMRGEFSYIGRREMNILP